MIIIQAIAKKANFVYQRIFENFEFVLNHCDRNKLNWFFQATALFIYVVTFWVL